MTRINAFFRAVSACLLLASAPVKAADFEAPLAVTIPAQASFRTTPTDEQSDLSRKYLQSGMESLRDGRPGRALQEFNDSVRLAPGAENFKALGTAYYQAGNSLKAVWAYRESLRLEQDPKVRALVDSLTDKNGPDAEARYARLMAEAPGEARAGRVDQAIEDYVDACRIRSFSDAESGGAGLGLAADSVEADLSRGDLAKAVETLCRVEPLRRANIPAEGRDMLSRTLGRLEKAEARAVRWSGMSLRDNQKAMLADHDTWDRTVRDKAAVGEPAR